jgi:hypothetical protein
MRRLPLFTLLALLLLIPAARSQAVSIYGTFSPAHLTGIRNGGCGGCINGGYTTTDFWAYGVGAGATLNLVPTGPVRLGVDARGATRPGTSGYDLGLLGLRLGLKVPLVSVKPYVQASGGYLATRTPVISGIPAGSTSTDKFGVYEIIGGIDYGILPFIDVRILEVGAGKGYQISGVGDTFGTYHPTLFTINTGVVFHF